MVKLSGIDAGGSIKSSTVETRRLANLPFLLDREKHLQSMQLNHTHIKVHS